MLLADTISLTVLGAIAGPGIFAAITGDVAWMWLFAGLIGVDLTTAGIKRMLGGGAWPLGRPAGAHGCGALCDGGSVGGAPGFPSGHMATVTMLVTVAVRWFSGEWESLVLGAGAAWIAAMAWARWAKRCHNLVQITGGIVLGILAGLLLAQFIQPK
jgi:hypothetical protein